MERKSKYPLLVNTSILLINNMTQAVMLSSLNSSLLTNSNNNMSNIITK